MFMMPLFSLFLLWHDYGLRPEVSTLEEIFNFSFC